MKKSLSKLISAVIASTMIFGCMPATGTINNNIPVVATAQAASTITVNQAAGWFETAYIEWAPVSNTTQYVVSYKKSGTSAYTMIDNELIRQYSGYWRADVVGLAAGSYDLKVEAYDKSGSLLASAEKTGLTVQAYDRSGGAFSKYSDFANEGLGAYNYDGTLKSDAQVLYVTKDTAKTVKAKITTDSKGTKTEFTGLQAILDAKQKGSGLVNGDPLDIRIIGKVSKSDLDSISSSAEGLQVKGKNAYAPMNVTIEGIGKDATVSDFGFLIRNSGSVEFRNFMIMNFMDDGLSFDTANTHIWVHNMEFVYGGPGGDSDQAKGDGTVDIKAKSRFVTVSYNHFFDSGKSSLCGMGSETAESHITYHHNWFDHSDSRHPRIRAMSVHVYNNYFDGNAKYGVGSAVGASVFVQNNYFNNCKYPVITGSQGADMISGKSVLSGEQGGVIKMCGNTIIGATSYTTYQQDSSNFDAYEVSSPSETIPSSVAAKGGSYNNFDTDTAKFDMHVNKLDAANDVPSIVMASAGRINGGDFPNPNRSKYPSLSDNTSYAVDTVLKNDIISYTSPVVSVGGAADGSVIITPPATTEASTEATTSATTEATTQKVTDETTESTTQAPVNPPEGDNVINNSMTISRGTNDNYVTVFADKNTSGAWKIDKATASATRGYIALTIGKTADITVTGGGEKALFISDDIKAGGDGRAFTGSDAKNVSVTGVTPGTYYIYNTGGNVTISSIIVTMDGDTPVNPDPTPLMGDANGDGSVTFADVQMVLDYASGKITSVTKQELADLNNDGKVTPYDAFLIGKDLI